MAEDWIVAFTYMLRCSDGSFYVGSTRNLNGRLAQHYAGAVPGHTASRLPVELVWYQENERVSDAFALEKRLQGWRRAKKIALIEGRFEDLPSLARGSG